MSCAADGSRPGLTLTLAALSLSSPSAYKLWFESMRSPRQLWFCPSSNKIRMDWTDGSISWLPYLQFCHKYTANTLVIESILLLYQGAQKVGDICATVGNNHSSMACLIRIRALQLEWYVRPWNITVGMTLRACEDCVGPAGSERDILLITKQQIL